MKCLLNKEEVTYRILDGEAVIINKKTSYFYTLNKTATFIWERLVKNELSLKNITESVACHYQKNEQEIDKDIIKFMARLSKERLVKTEKIMPASKDKFENKAAKNTKKYKAPKLTKIDKLEKQLVTARKYEAPKLTKFNKLGKLFIAAV